MDKQFALEALERAGKTFAQSVLAALAVDGVTVTTISWGTVLGVALTATLISILTSVLSLPANGTASLVPVETGRHAAPEEDSSPGGN